MRYESKHGRALRGRGAKVKGLPENLPPLLRNQVRCPVCGNGAGRTSRNRDRLRPHNDPSGYPCANHVASLDLVLTTVPPVNLPIARAWQPRNGEPSRLDAGSSCRECGKWLPGERSLCGSCYVAKNGTR